MKADYIKPSVYSQIYKYMTYENVLVLRVSLETGLRVGDVCKIKVDDIHGRKLRFVAEKTGKEGVKVLSKSLIKELLRISGGWGYVFKGARDPNSHRTRQAVWKNVTKACVEAGIAEHVTPHSARKTYAVGVFQDRGIGACAEELQHDRADTTMLYAFSNLLCAAEGASEGRSNSATFSMADVENAAYNGCIRALRDFAATGSLQIQVCEPHSK